MEICIVPIENRSQFMAEIRIFCSLGSKTATFREMNSIGIHLVNIIIETEPEYGGAQI